MSLEFYSINKKTEDILKIAAEYCFAMTYDKFRTF